MDIDDEDEDLTDSHQGHGEDDDGLVSTLVSIRQETLTLHRTHLGICMLAWQGYLDQEVLRPQ